MLRKGQEKMVDSPRVKLTLQVDVDPLLSFVNKISIMELNHKMYSFDDGLEFLLIVTYINLFGLLNYSTLSFPTAWRNSTLNRSRNENHVHPPLA